MPYSINSHLQNKGYSKTLIFEDIMETLLACKKDTISCCRIKEQRQKKSKMDCLRKLFEQYFYRGVLVYFTYRSLPYIISRNCMGCTTHDPSHRYHNCITRSSIEQLECNLSEMLDKVDFYMLYEFTSPIQRIGLLQRKLMKVIPSILLKAISLRLHGAEK